MPYRLLVAIIAVLSIAWSLISAFLLNQFLVNGHSSVLWRFGVPAILIFGLALAIGTVAIAAQVLRRHLAEISGLLRTSHANAERAVKFNKALSDELYKSRDAVSDASFSILASLTIIGDYLNNDLDKKIRCINSKLDSIKS